jgi:hypothetical protein
MNKNAGRQPSAGISLEGVHAYAEKSVEAGEPIHFRVSSTHPYSISIVRLGNLDDRAADTLAWPHEPVVVEAPQQQMLHPGSYVHVESGLPADRDFQALTLECWVRPWGGFPRPWQGLLTQHEFPEGCGVGLFLTDQGAPTCYFGDGEAYNPERELSGPSPLEPGKWHHLVGVFDGESLSLWVDGERVAGPRSISGAVRVLHRPLRLGAYAVHGCTGNFLDGDLAMPVIYGRALSEEDILQRFQGKALTVPELGGVLACWPLSEERGRSIHDISGHGRHGVIINGGTWMVGGPSFESKAVLRFEHYEPSHDAVRGHGLRLASDDLVDCHWEVTHTFHIPNDLRPGIYVGRLLYDDNTTPRAYDVTFIVRKPALREKAPILVLCATNTWLAYNATPFSPAPEPTVGDLVEWSLSGHGTGNLGAPGYCLYSGHAAGQPAYRLGLNMPWPVASPHVYYWGPQNGMGPYSHLVRGERYLHHWLEAQGHDFDVITDFDLHRDPSILLGYQVVFVNGHSEYWSIPAYEGLDAYLRGGGKVIAMTGNTMCWRVSFDEELTAMECRKVAAPARWGYMGTLESATFGECYHSDDGLRGGLMRECGYPCWRVLGLESAGFWNAQRSAGFTCDVPDHPFFAGLPEEERLEQGTEFAFGSIGHEWDVRANLVQQWRRNRGDVDEDLTSLPQQMPGMTVLGHRAPVDSDTVWDYFFRHIHIANLPEDARVAEMIHWQRPSGGEVFFVGSIAAGRALLEGSDRARWGRILGNVLSAFGVPAPEVHREPRGPAPEPIPTWEVPAPH